MAKSELYIVDIDRDAIWSTYIGAFPPGTNEIFRERTEHDCSCCKSFIRQVGGVVSIANGSIVTAWDVDTVGYPYDTVSTALADYVRSLPIRGVFRTPESRHGAEMTPEVVDGETIRWKHFVADAPQKIRMAKDAIGAHNGRIDAGADAKINVSVMRSDKERYQRLADHRGVALSTLVRDLLAREVNREDINGWSDQSVRYIQEMERGE